MGKTIVPCDKGGSSDIKSGRLSNYYSEPEFFIDYSEENVERIKTLTIADRKRHYGEKNILAIGLAAMHRHDALSDGAGGEVDYTSWNLDVLFEKPLANCGVATIEAAYYDFDDNGGLSDATGAAITLPPHNAARQGESYFILGSYLFPNQCCILGLPGRFQALTRYQEYDHDAVGAVAAGTTDALDLQLNYIMFGHKARISAVWTQLDTAGAGGEDDLFTIGTQLQF